MPLHDWTNPDGWGQVHTYWLVWLAEHLKTRLPPGYRPHITTMPALAIGAVESIPDVGVIGPRSAPEPAAELLAPDFEAEVAVLDSPELSLTVEHHGTLVAAIEIVSRRNKDRPDSRESYAAKYVGYLQQLVNVMIIDVLPRPHGFSFPADLARRLGLPGPPAPAAPVVASYRIDGRSPKVPPRVSVWCRRLGVGDPLPELPLPLSPDLAVSVDLEETYARAARSAYLE